MECPKCKKTVGEHDVVCRNCGIALREKPKKSTGFKALFSKKKSDRKDQPLLETSSLRKSLGSIVNGQNEKKIKIAFLIALAALIIVLIWVVIVQLSADKGGKAVMKQHAEDVFCFHTEKETQFLDIDTREDLLRISDKLFS